MRTISGRALGFLALCGFATSASAVTGNSVLQGQVNGSTVTITTSQQMAGAIVSLIYRGKEYIDSYDHGRELQSAVSYNNVGECFNPTEAGGRNDGASSTSQIFRQTSWQNYLTTITRMSFWLRGNEYYPQGCGPQFPSVTQAMHPANVSDHFLAKNVTLGYRTLQNVLEYGAKFTVPNTESMTWPGGSQQLTHGVFEITGYMPRDFSTFYTYDVSNNTLAPLSADLGEQSQPMIFSTTDDAHAMGVYSPELPQPEFPTIGYFRGAFGSVGQPGSTVKWSCAFRGFMSNGPEHSFRCYVVFGTRAEVQESMRLLIRSFTVAPNELPPAAPGPTAASMAQIVAYADGWGMSGQWWCDAHFGGNLGGSWDCLSVANNTCDYPVAGIGNRVSCQRFTTIATIQTYAQSPGLTGQWWCSAHFGGNLGGTWDCLSTNGVRNACDSDVPIGTQVRCGQR